MSAPPPAAEGVETHQDSTLLSRSAVMAAGTVVSRASGLVRTALLAAALGGALHADVFNVANTIPNMLYILLAGGVFNAVLVPQLVRSLDLVELNPFLDDRGLTARTVVELVGSLFGQQINDRPTPTNAVV